MKHKGKKDQKRTKKTQLKYNSEKHHMLNGARRLIKGMIPRPGKLKRQLEDGVITQEQYDAKVSAANAAAENWKRTVGLRTSRNH